MKKKLLLIVSICLCVLGMTACEKADPTTVDYNGYTYDQLQSSCQNTVATLEGMSDDDKTNYLTSGSDTTISLINNWDTATADIGAFVDFSDFKVTKSGKTLTAEQTVEFEDRSLILTYVYTYSSMEVEDVTVDLVYSTSEKMSKAGLNTIMALGTVFTVLILISLIISCFRVIPYLESKKSNKGKEIVLEKDRVVEQIVQREQLYDDLELTAVIAAAIAAATGTSTDDFVVRSIKRR